MQTSYEDSALADFSGYLAADEIHALESSLDKNQNILVACVQRVDGLLTTVQEIAGELARQEQARSQSSFKFRVSRLWQTCTHFLLGLIPRRHAKVNLYPITSERSRNSPCVTS